MLYKQRSYFVKSWFARVPLGFALFVCVLIAFVGVESKVAKAAPLGVNIAAPQFVDAMKTAWSFQSITEAPLKLDANGWPTGDAKVLIFDTRVNMPWNGPDPLAVPADESGTYHLVFTGQATLTPISGTKFTISNQKYNATLNITTAELNVPKGHNFLGVEFTGTKGGVKNVKLIRPGYATNTKQVFTTAFMNALKPFSTLRYGDFSAMNNHNHPGEGGVYPAKMEWKQRRLVTDSTQSNKAPIHGVAWEYAIQLANKSGKDMWINVPIATTDDYVNQMATLFKKTLNPKINVYVEYSNEVWNNGFVQAWWNNEAAKSEGIDRHIRYAKRTVEIGNIFRKAFAETSSTGRIRPVLAWQEWDNGAMKGMLEWVEKTHGASSKVLYGIAIAPYLEAKDTSSVDTIFTDLDKNVGEHRSMIAPQFYLAFRYGIKLLGYEGGMGMNGTQDLDKKLAANRDPRVKPFLKNFLLNNWYGAGGNLFMYYHLTGTPSQWGQWGLIEGDITKPNTYKYQAAVEVAKAPLPPVTVGHVLPTVVAKTVSIDQNSYEGSNWKPGTPNQNLWNQVGSRQDYLLRAVSAGTYSITIESLQDKPSGTTQIFLDNKLLDTSALPATIKATLKPGLHSFYLISQGKTAMGGGKQIIITRTG